MNSERDRIGGGRGRPLRIWMAGILGFGLLLSGARPPEASGAVQAVEDGIRFTYLDPAASTVFLAGSFNGWSTTAQPMEKKGDLWSVVVRLDAGEHEYKFVVDGQWIADPDNPATIGEYGNSAISVTPAGELATLQATSNTPLSPKIWMGGRSIGTYIYRQDPLQANRYELGRPRLDIDIGLRVRINADLVADVLMNIGNEAENVELWQTRLNFDRGSLTLDNSAVFLQAWDNVGITTWEDPLHLVGDVGIYNHRFGYGTVGARLRKEILGLEGELLYADNSEPGGTGHPSVRLGNLSSGDWVELTEEGQYVFATTSVSDYNSFDNANLEDVLAVRAGRSLGSGLGGRWTLGAMMRIDRGYHAGSLAHLEVDPADSSRTTGNLFQYGNTFEEWRGWGGHLRFETEAGIDLEAEYLRGDAWIDAREGTEAQAKLNTVAGEETPTAEVVPTTEQIPTQDRTFDLDRSHRAWLGVRWQKGPLGIDWGASWEYEDHAQSPAATGLLEDLESSLSVIRGEARRSWDQAPGLGHEADAGISFEYFDFSYDPDAPWETQLWFDRRNLWLESNENEVTYERMTLLGGRDALIWRPELRVRLEEGHEVDLAYRGTLASQGFDRRPKYWESLYHLQGFLRTGWRASIDARIARFDDPALDLEGTFHAVFVEIAYMPVERVSIALSYGVDPYVIDDPVNEYAYIGRDLFLFEAGANGENAETNYRSMGKLIQQAEQELEDERRIQLEAILHF